MSGSRTDRPATLPEVLERAALRFPSRGLTLLDRRARVAGRRTWPELLEACRAGAGRLAAVGVGRRDVVLLALPTSWSLIDAWWGCVLLGARPVAMSPGGTLGASPELVRQLEDVVQGLAPRLVLAGAPMGPAVAAASRDLAGLLLDPRDLELRAPAPWTAPPAEPEDAAFLQLTSGSTGHRRAVVISHRAAVHNALASDEAIGAPFAQPISSRGDTMVSWLPLHHDMGLVGCLLFSMACGFDLVLMPPDAFLARPTEWLRWLGRGGNTIAPAPNFAYQLCVERLAAAPLDGIDLSRWTAALVGAEMVRPDTMRAAAEVFAASGFRPETLRPCYGMAEATLAVTFDVRGEGVRTRPLPEGAEAGFGLSEVVSTGVPVVDTEVIVSAPDGTVLPAGSVGEIRVRGPGLFDGYYRDPEGTAECFRDGWLRTGDLGFLHDGELHVTGRRKEVLIVRGHNVMPHEVEWLAEQAAGAGGTCRCGAFSIVRGPGGEEAVVVMEAGSRDPEALRGLEDAIRVRVGRALALPLADVAFVKRGRLPKTSSGKVRRGELRRRYLAGELERLTP